jgi:hypothetical protein
LEAQVDTRLEVASGAGLRDQLDVADHMPETVL